MDEPIWLSRSVVETLQADQVREHGGQLGFAMPACLSQRWFGLARNHAFLDGNKRVAFDIASPIVE